MIQRLVAAGDCPRPKTKRGEAHDLSVVHLSWAEFAVYATGMIRGLPYSSFYASYDTVSELRHVIGFVYGDAMQQLPTVPAVQQNTKTIVRE